MRESLAELAGLIDRYAGVDGIHETPIPRLHLFRSSRATEPIYALHEPALCLIAQGRKQAMLGSQVYVYDRAQYLMVSVDVPVVGQVIEASPQSPYLSLRFDLDPEMLSALLLDVEGATAGDGSPGPALSLSTVTPELLDAVIRLLRLLAVPKDIPALAPLVEKEILYRLMVGEQSAKFREIALGDGRLQQINRAIKWIKQNYRSPLRIERVAAEARMSPSSLHSHFKSVTAMSPLQYQKQLRLQEARRLILTGAHDAASAGYFVGYSSPSQFSREYRRLFGAPPARDVARLKDLPESFLAM